ncbi:MAG: hypothetical protein EXQ86_00475 [Rhodospirillales bacterium]|nr:hypothetical protein [Rhodospirillales bacterium]
MTRTLAEAVSSLSFERMPKAVRERAQQLILDTVGCALGARAIAEGRRHAAAASLFGAGGTATCWGSAGNMGPAGAAFVNANLANVLDLDETFRNFTHIGAAVVPAVLAVAEAHGRSGRDVITGVVAGYEVAARLGLAMPILGASQKKGAVSISWSKAGGQGWLALGAGAAAARILGLDAGRTAHALGITAFAAPLPTLGRWWHAFPMPMTKYLLYGSMAAAGVIGAGMAAEDVTGDAQVLDGESGFWTMTGASAFHPATAMTPFGHPWWILRAAFKPYPCTRQIHWALDAVAQAITAARTAGFGLDAITDIDIGVQNAVLGPHYQNRNPTDAPTASFSLPYTAALVALGVEPSAQWLAPETIARADVRAMMRRVRSREEKRATTMIARQLAEPGMAGFEEGLATVTLTAGGRRFTAEVARLRGDPEPGVRFSQSEIEEKFCRYSAGVLRPGAAERFIEGCRALDLTSDVRPLLQLLAA